MYMCIVLQVKMQVGVQNEAEIDIQSFQLNGSQEGNHSHFMLLPLDVGSTAQSHTTHLDIRKPLLLGVDMLGHREPRSDAADFYLK